MHRLTLLILVLAAQCAAVVFGYRPPLIHKILESRELLEELELKRDARRAVLSKTFVLNPVDHVDLFFGTAGGGNVFPGATRPFGMVKLGVDVIGASADTYSGYAPDGNVSGFSMMHESGTGGAPEYGIVSQLPYLGAIDFTKDASLKRTGPDVATVGRYLCNFTNGISVDAAAGERSGILAYDFGTDNSDAKVIVNVAHHLTAPSRPWWTQYFVNGSISVNDDLRGYTGQATIKGGWGLQTPWTIYYCADFDTAATDVTAFHTHTTYPGQRDISSAAQDESFGVVLGFPNLRRVQTRVGVSFMSVQQACANIKTDFADTYDIDSAVNVAQQHWHDEVFGRVNVATDNSTLAGLIYTTLYGAHLLPSNRTGENPNWETQLTYYDDWFTLWDTFRLLHPLFNILNPTRALEIVQSLVNIYKNEGYTPDGRSANQNGRTQGGSNSDIVMADAYVKGISGVNWTEAFAAMQKNAEVAPPYWYDAHSPTDSSKQGRGALPDWLKYGYITRNYTRSVTRTMEYSYDDFALLQVALGLGLKDDYQKYLKRSEGWQKMWNFDASSKDYDYKGFIQPRNSDGAFNYDNYDPTSCGGCYWGDDEYEGKPMEYGWAVPFDVQTLKKFIGSDELFARRLDDMFGLHGSDVADIGNEPSFLTPYLYNYVNQHHKTVELIRYLINTKFSVGPKALPGNSDAGAMQSWYFFALIGLYPVAGTTTYLLGSPFVPYVGINLENGKQLEIISLNLTSESFYVQSVKVNGNSYGQNWVSHEDIFTNGGKIEFQMGTEQKTWETGSVPPSPGNASAML